MVAMAMETMAMATTMAMGITMAMEITMAMAMAPTAAAREMERLAVTST